MEEALRCIDAGVPDTDIFTELQLPIQTIGATKASISLLFSSAVQTGLASFLSSSSSSTVMCCVSLLEELLRLGIYGDGHVSLQEWTEQCENDKRLPQLAFSQSKNFAQKALVKPVHGKQFNNLPPEDTHRQAFRASKGLPESKDWVLCASFPKLRT